MCFHYAMSAEAQKLKNRFSIEIKEEIQPIYHVNGFQFPKMPVITNDKPDEIQLFNWGLIPKWVKSETQANEIKSMTLNAKSETIFEKPSFKYSISQQRCLIPSTGFFEWREIGKTKIPYFISHNSMEIFSLGGIWSSWINNETGELLNTFSIITTEANELMSIIHNKKRRMPLILTGENEREWINGNLDKQTIKDLMQTLPSGELYARTIDKRIASPKFFSNIPEITNEVQYEGIDSKIS